MASEGVIVGVLTTVWLQVTLCVGKCKSEASSLRCAPDDGHGPTAYGERSGLPVAGRRRAVAHHIA